MVDAAEDKVFDDESVSKSTITHLVDVHESLQQLFAAKNDCQLLGLIENIVRLSERENITNKLHDCREKLPELRCLHQGIAADKMQQTGKIVQAAMADGVFEVCLMGSGECTVSLTYGDEGGQTLDQESLGDFQSRCLLLSSVADNQHSNDTTTAAAESQKRRVMRHFCGMMDVLLDVASLAAELALCGHFDYKSRKWSFRVGTDAWETTLST